MKALFLVIALVFVGLLAVPVATAQTTAATPATPGNSPQASDPSISPNRALGEVKVIDTAAKQIIVKTDAGSLVTVVLSSHCLPACCARREDADERHQDHFCRCG